MDLKTENVPRNKEMHFTVVKQSRKPNSQLIAACKYMKQKINTPKVKNR